MERDYGSLDLDVCATAETAKAPLYFTAIDNGLAQPWRGLCWCNPPYSDVHPWIEHAFRHALERDASTLALVPVWSERGWWHDYALKATEIRFVRGRMQFDGARRPAWLSLCLLVFRAGRVGGPVVIGPELRADG